MQKTKKTLNLIALIVFLMSNFLNPISYAIDDLDIGSEVDSSSEASQSDDSTVISNDGDKSSEQEYSETPMDSDVADAPQNDDNTVISNDSEKSSEGNETPIDSDVADAPQNGDNTVISNDSEKSSEGNETSMDSHVADAPQNDEKTGETSAIDTLKDLISNAIEKLPSEPEKSEIDIARETLNTDPIQKSETYNKVTVNVLAPVNTFPEGTKLVIEAIKGDALEEVRQQISDESTNNVDEDAEIVAFDIRFEYELRDGSRVELQPKENTVQVTFDYSKNKELKKAETDDSQQIEIYHVNDKDENGEKVAEGEEKVEKIEINQEKSEEVDNALVVDAESFSTYAVVVNNVSYDVTIGDTLYHTTLDGNNSTMNDFYYRTLTVGDITIMDRNLGATTGWNRSSSYYRNSNVIGYHYQWGRNYGKDPADTTTVMGEYDSSSVSDWGQGPCPAGWHVPSSAEWDNLVNVVINAGSQGTNMGKLLQMPFAGFRDYSNSDVGYLGLNGYYWSSTPLNADDAYLLFFNSSSIYPQSYFSRALGFSVRCFKDEYVAPPESYAYLMTGSAINNIMVSLAGGTGKIYYFSGSDNLPDSSVQKENISMSGEAVYMWYADNTIYYHSDASVVYMNSDSSSMFNGCSRLTSLDLSNFNTSKVIDMSYMFYGCSSLQSLDLSSFDTSNVTNMSYMFNGCASLQSLDLSSFDTSRVTNMSYMFYACSKLQSLYLSSFDTSNVTNMSYMFNGCASLESLDLSSFDTSNVTDMSYMFGNCSRLQSLNLSSFDTINVIYMSNMFNGCSSLESLDLSSFDTSNVTDMSYMFGNCSSLRSLNLSSFDTSNVINMSSMFNGCSSLESLNLSIFDTSNVINMSSMFNGCSSLESLDLSSFDTSNVTDMSSMFNGCSSLKTIYIGSIFTGNGVTNSNNMFYGATQLVGGFGTKFDSSLVDKTLAVIDSQAQSGYFTDKNEITVRFILSGSVYTGIVTSYGSGVSKPSNPEGYNVVWYYTGMEDEFDFATDKITEYMELYGNLTCANGYTEINGECVQQFTVTLNASQNGGTIDGQGTKALTVTSGSSFERSSYSGDKTGYTFVGWSESDTGTGVLTSNPTITSNKTFYAVFKKTVTVTFSKGAGVSSVSPSSDTCTAWNTATTCSVPAATATCNAGYRSPVWSITDMTSLSASTTNTASCTACAAGTYTTAGNTASTCSNCAAGYYCPGSSDRVACNTLGSNYTSDANATANTSCYINVAAGSKKDGATSDTTSGCGDGKYSTTHKSYYNSADNSCTNIEAGCYGSSASSSCPAQCQGRTKYSAAGKSECSTVSAGYYTTGCGSDGNKCTGQSQCTAGTSCSNGVQSSCVASTSTVAGTYSSNAGATSCTTASDGNYVATAGASGQTQCTVGNYCKDGKIIACPSGYTSDNGAKAQTECYITVEGGKYLGTANGTTQTECAAGTYKGEHNVNYGSISSCELCPSGKWSDEGSSSCNYTIATIPTAANFCKSLTYNGSSQILVNAAGNGYTWTAGTTRTNAGSQDVTATLSNGYVWSDYTKGTKSISCSIAKASGTASVTMEGWTYGGTAKNPVPTSSTNGTSNVTYKYKVSTAADSTYTTTKPSEAGIYTVQATFAATDNYNAVTATANFTIAKASITVPSSPAAKTYNGNSQNHGITVPSNTSIVAGSSTTSATNVGTYNVVFQLSDTSNYQWSDGTITNKTVTWTINQAKTATLGSCNSLTYNGSAQTLAGGGEHVTYTNNSGKDATGYTVTVTTDENYQFSDGEESKTLSCEIAKKAVTVTVDNKSMTYGGGAPTFSYTVVGAVGSEAAVSGIPTYTVNNSGGTQVTVNSSLAVGTYAITLSGLTAGANYSITYVNGTLTVNKAEPTNNSGSSSSGGGGGGGGGGKKIETSDKHLSADEKDSSLGNEGKDSDPSLQDNNLEGGENINSSDDLFKDGNNAITTSNTSSSDNTTLSNVPSTNGTSIGTSYTKEQNDAYSFAKSNGITTTQSIEEAKMNSPLTRIQMAKMLSNYAINVLGKTPDTSKTIKFKDVSNKMDKQYDNGVILSYQLGIMGQNVKNNNFRPNDTVTRAEFVTALSRLLYSTPEGTNKATRRYYEPHMAKLYNEGIINKTDPKMKEKRGYVMIMLMRSAQKG